MLCNTESPVLAWLQLESGLSEDSRTELKAVLLVCNCNCLKQLKQL